MTAKAPAKRRKPGRPTKLTKAHQRICDLLRKGMPRERSARLAGVSEATFYRWMREGELEGPKYARQRQFRQGVMRAEDEFVERAMEAGVVDAFATRPCTGPALGGGACLGEDCPACDGRGERYVHDLRERQAATRFILPHRFAGEFSTRAEVRHEGPGGGPVKVEATVAVRPLFTDEQLDAMSPDQLEAALRAMVPAGDREP